VFEFEKKIKFKKVHIQNCLNMGNVLNFKNFRFEFFFETLARGWRRLVPADQVGIHYPFS
jgi:hypothetical protein